MSRSLKHIISVYLLAAIVFATSGVQIYGSFCACSKAQSISLTSKETCCSRASSQSSETNGSRVSPRCCHQETILIKFQGNYLNDSYSPNIELLPTFVAAYAIGHISQDLLHISVVSLPKINDRAEPPLYGKSFVCFVNSLKIPLS